MIPNGLPSETVFDATFLDLYFHKYDKFLINLISGDKFKTFLLIFKYFDCVKIIIQNVSLDHHKLFSKFAKIFGEMKFAVISIFLP